MDDPEGVPRAALARV